MGDDLENLRGRREFVSAYLMAITRSDELLRVCANVAGDSADAARAVAEAFDVTEIVAGGILDLQVRRFTPHAIAQIRYELAEIERLLADREQS